MPVEKSFGLQVVIELEYLIFFFEHFWAEVISQKVVDSITCKGRYDQYNCQQINIQPCIAPCY